MNKLLIVEDDDIIRANYKDIISDVCEVFEASDGVEAYLLYKSINPDVMIVDINMPNMNGIELVTKIRQEQDLNTKIIMLTAHTDVDTLVKTNELYLTRYLVKPPKRRELLEALEKALIDKDTIDIRKKVYVKLDSGFMWYSKRSVLIDNSKEIHLTKKETKLMAYMSTRLGEIVSYEDLIYNVWDDSDTYSIDSVKNVVKNIRKKTSQDLIKTAHGMGYILE